MHSNQGFKHNSAHMTSLNLAPKLSVKPRFRMFITNVGYTKSKRSWSLDSFLLLFSLFDIISVSFSRRAFEDVGLWDMGVLLDTFYGKLRKKCPYSDLFWSVFSRIRTGSLVRMRENTDQNNSEYGHFSRSDT